VQLMGVVEAWRGQPSAKEEAAQMERLQRMGQKLRGGADGGPVDPGLLEAVRKVCPAATPRR
jgi:hypothetical protein